ncbi:MAG: hypothetical protein VYB28_00120 [Gemmatimonadota bacterium]|nr:hypothetical protein [Gemmatimonadota bacterium]|tara:strand:+ start:24153 stop:24323 length:171 start_codon:yes stop_codon:yes gene_type:complete
MLHDSVAVDYKRGGNGVYATEGSRVAIGSSSYRIRDAPVIQKLGYSFGMSDVGREP